MSYMKTRGPRRPGPRGPLGATVPEWVAVTPVVVSPSPTPPPPPPKTSSRATIPVRFRQSTVVARYDLAGLWDVLNPLNLIPGYAATHWLKDEIKDSICTSQADNSSAQWKSQLEAIKNEYVVPNDLYSPQQVNALVSAVMGAVNSVHNMILQVRVDYDVAALAYAEDEFNSIGADSIQYLDAARTALSSGADAIQSSGLRRWALDALETTVDNASLSYYVACQKPWWLSAVQVFQAAFDTVASVVTQIVSALLKIAKTVLKIPDTIDTIITVGLWAGGAYLAWKAYQALESRSSR